MLEVIGTKYLEGVGGGDLIARVMVDEFREFNL
jgi:hypothetical protein